MTRRKYNDIARALHDKGDYDGALEHCEKALAVRESVLGEGHPNMANAYNNIAGVLRDKGNND